MIFFCELAVEMARNVKDVMGLDTIGELHQWYSQALSLP